MSDDHSPERLDDDDAPTPTLAEVAALMLRRSLRAAAAGRTAEAARLLRLHRDYRALEVADAQPIRVEPETVASEVHDVHHVHPVSAHAAAPSRLRLSLLDAAVNKAVRRGDLATLRRIQHRLAEARAGPP